MKNSVLIQLKSISKKYKRMDGADSTILDGIDFTLNRFDFKVIMGPSGSGKTTLLSILALIETPDAGRYLFRGQDITDHSIEELNAIRTKNIGLLPQHSGLIDAMSLKRNMELPLLYRRVKPAIRRKIVADCIVKLELESCEHSLVKTLSGGERLRAALGREICWKPDILLCDEPTAALDENKSMEIISVLKSMARDGAAVVIGSHDPLVIKSATSHVALKK